MAWQKRVLKDLEDLRKANFIVKADDGSDDIKLNVFQVLLEGPKDTPYANGSWYIRFTIPETFPFKSPSVGFIQNIMHPNIDFASGSICLDTLNAKWSPCTTLRHIIEVLLPYLLTYPNPDDPLNREAATLLKTNEKEYIRQVVHNVKTHSLPLKSQDTFEV